MDTLVFYKERALIKRITGVMTLCVLLYILIVGTSDEDEFMMDGEQAVEQELQGQVPAFTGIRSQSHGENKSILEGSGFIVRLENEVIRVLTAAHVAGSEEQVEVVFYDGTILMGEILKRDEEADLALIEVDRSGKSRELPEGLMEVKIDSRHWKEVEEGAAIGYCYRPPGESGWITKTGYLLNKESQLWEPNYSVMQYSAENEQGASGSAVLDETGTLIAMVLGYTQEQESISHWGIGLPALMEFYSVFSE